MRAAPLITLIAAAGVLGACHRSKSPTYTLYRSEGVGDTARVHVATFDAVDDETGYNRETCERTRELFQVRPQNLARFWCEPGRFSARKQGK